MSALDFSSTLPEKEWKDGMAVTPVTSCRRSYPGKLEAIYPAIAAALIGTKASCCTKPINELLFSNVLQGIVNDQPSLKQKERFLRVFRSDSSLRACVILHMRVAGQLKEQIRSTAGQAQDKNKITQGCCRTFAGQVQGNRGCTG